MKGSAAMTSARAVQDAAFKNCCLRSGRYDGSKRNHFFPRVVINQFLRAEERGLSLENDNPTFTNLSAVPKQNPRRRLATHMTKGGQHGYQLRKGF